MAAAGIKLERALLMTRPDRFRFVSFDSCCRHWLGKPKRLPKPRNDPAFEPRAPAVQAQMTAIAASALVPLQIRSLAVARRP